MNPANRPHPLATVLIAALVIAGLLINVFLLTRAWGDAAIAGCGGGPCDEVLASRWSSLLGLPVPAFGIAVYALLLMSFFRRLEILRLPLLGGIAGAALWFILVQALILRKFCPWCMTAHALGISIVILETLRGSPGTLRRTAAWGGVAMFTIANMQVFGPAPARHRVENSNAMRPANQAAGQPRLGPPDARHVIVEYFDYQCASCRAMAEYVETFVASQSGRVAVQLMPVPLDDACNPHLGPSNKTHPGSCVIARISLAVWRQRPDVFPAFHKALIADPSETAARRLALQWMRENELASALADPWIESSIQANITTWQRLSNSNDKLPKLIIRDKRVIHGLPPGEGEFLRVMKQELGF